MQSFIANHNSAVRHASLSASSIQPASVFVRDSVIRAGNGTIQLAGAYTGAQPETEVEIEIAAGGGTPSASLPVFAGVGSGDLSVVGVTPDATVQELTFTLADLGVDTATAVLDLGIAVLAARVSGAAGNQVRLSVTPRLVKTPVGKATLADWTSAEPTKRGQEWDFGGLPLVSDGQLDAHSPRIAFGNDPAVYRPWREFKDGEWCYGLSPALMRTVERDTPLWAVSGDYLVTVSNGSVSETFEVVTLHDLLVALSASDLVEVRGVVAADRKPGGASVVDLPLVTSAWVQKVIFPQNARRPGFLYETAPLAPTETVILRCIEASAAGNELWLPQGPVLGAALPIRTATEAVIDRRATRVFIPKKSDAIGVSGGVTWKFAPADRSDEENPPQVCLNPVRLGINARGGKRITFVYKRRPASDCDCTNARVGKINNYLLGLEDINMGDLDPAVQSRLVDLYGWRRQATEAHVYLTSGLAAPGGHFVVYDVVEAGTAETLGTVAIQWASRQQCETFGPVLAGQTFDVMGSWVDVPGSGPGEVAEPLWSHGIRWQQAGTERAWRLVAPYLADCSLQSPRYATGYAAASGAMADLLPSTAEGDMGWLDETVSLLVQGLLEVYQIPAALAEWDACLDDLKVQAQAIARQGDDLWGRSDFAALSRRQAAQMDYCRALAGILPKADAGAGGGGGGVWRDLGGDFWWEDTAGCYLPAFSNSIYYSARRATGAEAGDGLNAGGVGAAGILNTREFAFGLAVPCDVRLKPGDSFTIEIESVSAVEAWKPGDEIAVSVVGAAPAWLTGGVDGSDTRTWSVTGSVAGRLPPFAVPAGTHPVHTACGVSVSIREGGIPFELGDTFRLSVEAGQFRWRRDGGAWSALADLPPGAEQSPLFDGVTARFVRGDAPSFVAGDRACWRVLQPGAPDAVRAPGVDGWAWAGDDAVLSAEFGAPVAIQAVALAGHRLPASAIVVVELSDDGVAWTPVPVDCTRSVAIGFLPAPTPVRWLRISVASAAGGRLGWVWAGVPLTTSVQAEEVRLSRAWARIRGSGINPSAFCAGSGRGGEIAWGMLAQADVDALLEMVDHCHARDEPAIFIPSEGSPEDAALIRFDVDAIALDDWHHFAQGERSARVISMKLPLAAVMA